MKRTLTAAIIAINAVLVVGWLGFEWFIDDRIGVEDELSSTVHSPEESSPSVTAEPRPVSAAAGSGTGDGGEARESEVPSAFDWRRAANREPVPDRTRPRQVPDPGSRPAVVETHERDPVASSPVRAQPARSGATEPEPEDRPPTRAVQGETRADRPATPAEEEVRDDPSEDILPPELEWIQFAPAQVGAGQETTLSASATDDLAGVREIVGRISSPSGNAHLGFALSFNASIGFWETVIRIPDKAESGRWQISWLRLTDNANNARDERWGPGGVPGSFLIVSSNDGDGDPPVLRSVTLDRTTMGQGETVQAIVDVLDEQSGVRFVSGTFQSPSGKAWAPFTTTRQGSLWSGPVTVPEDGECGEWTLRRITAIDEANNQATWGAGDERITGISFYRSFTGSCDSEPPVLTRLELRPRFVGNDSPSQIQITAFIEDLGSGVATASGFAMVADQSSTTPQRVHFVLSKSSDAAGSPWVGTAEIPQHSMVGRWEIRALRISDQARNQKTWGMSDPAMAEAWFVVE